MHTSGVRRLAKAGWCSAGGKILHGKGSRNGIEKELRWKVGKSSQVGAMGLVAAMHAKS